MTNQNQNQNVNEMKLIDITELLENFLKAVKKFWLPMLITVVVCAGGYLGYSWFTHVPMYQSQSTFSINTQDSSLVLGGSSGSDQIKESLPYIMQSQYMKNLVMEDLGYTHFPATIEIESKELANYYVLKVNAEEPQVAYDVLNSMVENCPRASVYVLGKISLEVLDASGMPESPSNGVGNKMTLVKGALFGMLLCLAAAIFYIMTNRTVQREEDLKKYLSVSCLAALPYVSFKKRRKEIDKHLHIHNEKVGGSFIEMVRTMRTRVQREADKIGAKTILVTSSVPEEGKSTVAANLALSLAEKGGKVMLVDLDLRNPSIREVIDANTTSTQGVADVLRGNSTWSKSTYYIKKWNLHALFGGNIGVKSNGSSE